MKCDSTSKCSISGLIVITLVVLIGGISSFCMGYFVLPKNIIIIECENGDKDCYPKDNPFLGIPFVEYYAIKLAMKANRWHAAEGRSVSILRAYDNLLERVQEKYPQFATDKISMLRKEIFRSIGGRYDAWFLLGLDSEDGFEPFEEIESSPHAE